MFFYTIQFYSFISQLLDLNMQPIKFYYFNLKNIFKAGGAGGAGGNGGVSGVEGK